MALRPAIERRLRELGLPPDDAALDRLAIHARLLREWNPVAGLVSAGDAGGPDLHRHYLESVRALPCLEAARRGVDLGSGAGFPGLIWAAFRPELEMIVAESSRRKAAFLRQAAVEMGLVGVTVRAERIEEPEHLAALGADLLTTRATGRTDLLVAAGRLAEPPTRLVLFLSEERAAAFRDRAPRDYHRVATTPLASGGAIVVLDRDVPRGTST